MSKDTIFMAMPSANDPDILKYQGLQRYGDAKPVRWFRYKDIPAYLKQEIKNETK